ncbi:hypothetical protein D3C77_513300 [compost metagenome]
MTKHEFWRRKLHQVPAQLNPIHLKALESKEVLITPSTTPPGYQRRIRQVIWNYDKKHVQVYLANKRIGTPVDPGAWLIVLQNASNEEVDVDVFGIEEEMIGTVNTV